MINNVEAREAFLQIQAILLQSELSWLVSQVQGEISRGKISSKSIKEIKDNPNLTLFESFDYTPSKNTSKEQIQTSELYSEQEQLSMLLDALHEISEINSIRKQILNNLKSIDGQITSVEFIPEDAENDGDVMTDQNLQRQDETFTKLRTIVNQLKVM